MVFGWFLGVFWVFRAIVCIRVDLVVSGFWGFAFPGFGFWDLGFGVDLRVWVWSCLTLLFGFSFRAGVFGFLRWISSCGVWWILFWIGVLQIGFSILRFCGNLC